MSDVEWVGAVGVKSIESMYERRQGGKVRQLVSILSSLKYWIEEGEVGRERTIALLSFT